MGGGLGGDDEDFAPGGANGGEEGIEGAEVGDAEGTPVAAEVREGVSGGFVERVGKRRRGVDEQTTQRKEYLARASSYVLIGSEVGSVEVMMTFFRKKRSGDIDCSIIWMRLTYCKLCVGVNWSRKSVYIHTRHTSHYG